MTSIPFHKLEGFGNDFVLFDLRRESGSSKYKRITAQRFLRGVADRTRGIGCDQVLILTKPCRLHIFNADGSRAEMCGNGLRSAAWYLWFTRQVSAKESITVATDSGELTLRLLRTRLKSAEIIADVGHVTIKPTPRSLRLTRGLSAVCVDAGPPHVVVFGFWPKSNAELERMGSQIENDRRSFPKRTNVNFVRVASRSGRILEAQIWERGVGITKACGTGAVAIALAAAHQGLLPVANRPIKVRFPGGCAIVHAAQLQGLARYVFSGSVSYPL